MPTVSTLGFTILFSFDYSVQDGSGGPANFGDPGSVIVWTSANPDDSYSSTFTEDGDGNLEVSTAGDNFDTTATYTGYAVNIGGNNYPVFKSAGSELFIPSPAAGQPGQFIPSTDFPSTGTSNPYTGQINSFQFCFLSDTAITTRSGEVAVQDLSIGDLICTAEGQTVPVKWIGRQTVMTHFAPAERLMPVRFKAGSLGDGLPHSDLTVTADHAMLIDGVLCNASALVNGTTITRVPLDEMGDTFTVYHIETEAHEIILANGAPAETFIDNVSRRVFDNFAEYEALYGDTPEMTELPYPRAMSARQVPSHLRSKLSLNRVA
ncbi:Hint domain-containing protein [Falsiphaeobacter marinintestinus]|uniref:Hint domain-containing protein n=1 Tax=Falsiphaeobacter marinintestinus TaxID=1492905 RepID=UPI0011B38FB3|nr:Hint domain-containing protein [Phaeobacter marinintestinus]